MNKKEYDYVLVGAGLFNCVFAHQAKEHGKKCLVIDKRNHLGGNAYCNNVNGIAVHQYGPHIFHTSNKDVWDYVNRFVDFNNFVLSPIAINDGKLFNLPFNMNTFNKMWGTITPDEVDYKIKEQISEYKDIVPANLEEQALSLVGKDIYETLIKGYTEKQWGRPCKELPAYIIKRLPIRLTYNNNYFNDRYQGIPEGGYNILIDKLLDGIEYKTNCNYFDDEDYFKSIADKIVFSGPIDQFYEYKFGELEYRSLYFQHLELNKRNYQGNAVVNYTNSDVPYTRIVEHKFFDINNKDILEKEFTVITREYPKEYKDKENDEPYYPIENSKNKKIYDKYKALADTEDNVIFGGRLGTYKYLNMDQVIEQALNYWK